MTEYLWKSFSIDFTLFYLLFIHVLLLSFSHRTIFTNNTFSWNFHPNRLCDSFNGIFIYVTKYRMKYIDVNSLYQIWNQCFRHLILWNRLYVNDKASFDFNALTRELFEITFLNEKAFIGASNVASHAKSSFYIEQLGT